ncbi:T9SS type A sorting domain-containing protein [Microvirga sp. STR05]|uniref:T9SS type A sorting domain-containing protein n=1 Tax=Hymenobacter duratus TaxID=2771356 RepID=A0ABR8JHI4_9BACT|nr:T9SS type A sorting domain-containing protein [Hymenobacter duratus]MBD2715168.1 T9SS type A sorting domain-containing protein [Hymenobacter duratus]MBR7950075.1 T9SS type A sorting domain-containing protein [Microvirga sp. STR05]
MAKNCISLVRNMGVMVAVTLLSLSAWAQQSIIDPTFPPIQATKLNSITGAVEASTINDIVRQPDGKYIIGGDFTAINGVAASRLARLEANGTLDAAFTAACATNGPVNSLALQPDGRLLVGGSFTTLAGSGRIYLGRLLPSGTLDSTFTPASSAIATSYGIAQVLIQPDAQLLVVGRVNMRGAGFSEQQIVRLNGTNGQYDPSFQYALPTPDTSPHTILIQPDGKILVAANGPSYRRAFMLIRLQPDGTIDTAFSPLESSVTADLNGLALDAAGRIYAGGMFQGSPGNSLLRRYLPDGTIDSSFGYFRSFTVPPYVGAVKALSVQPNGRVLLAHATVERVQSNGSADAGFITGIAGNVRRFLVQPDGAIMIAGAALSGVVTGSATSLVRVLDANVLGIMSSVADARTVAWPVPARETLNLRLDAGSRPQRVQLLDVLGQPVLTLEQPTDMLTLPVAGLAAGTYYVQVEYANAGRVLRRVVLY